MSCCPPAKNFPNSRSMLIFEKWKKAKTWIGEKFLVLCCPCIVCPWIVWVTSARKRKTPTIGIVATITFVASFLVSSVCTTNLIVILYLQTNLIVRVVRCLAFSVMVLVLVLVRVVKLSVKEEIVRCKKAQNWNFQWKWRRPSMIERQTFE